MKTRKQMWQMLEDSLRSGGNTEESAFLFASVGYGVCSKNGLCGIGRSSLGRESRKGLTGRGNCMSRGGLVEMCVVHSWAIYSGKR